MKALIVTSFAACCFAGCATNDFTRSNGRTPNALEATDDQPQTAVAGTGSLMPGAFDSRRMQTGQFTGRERTNDQVGQRPTLPREADPRELARSEASLAIPPQGAGTLGQRGVSPDEPVSADTLMETTADTVAPPAHVAVTPPAARVDQEIIEGVGSPPVSSQGEGSSTNIVESETRPD